MLSCIKSSRDGSCSPRVGPVRASLRGSGLVASEATGEHVLDELAQPGGGRMVLADLAFANKVAGLLDCWCAERSFVASGAAWLILYIYRRIITQGGALEWRNGPVRVNLTSGVLT